MRLTHEWQIKKQNIKGKNMEDKKKLMRSSSDKWLAGVLGGIANYLGWDPALLRLCYLLLTLCSVGFPGVIAYIILWMCMPQDINTQP